MKKSLKSDIKDNQTALNCYSLDMKSFLPKEFKSTLAPLEIMTIFCLSVFLIIIIINNDFVKYERAIKTKHKKRYEKNSTCYTRLINGIYLCFSIFRFIAFWRRGGSSNFLKKISIYCLSEMTRNLAIVIYITAQWPLTI